MILAQACQDNAQSGRVGGTDTRTTVLDGLVRDGEFGKIVASHLRLDLNGVENLLRSKPKSHHHELNKVSREE